MKCSNISEIGVLNVQCIMGSIKFNKLGQYFSYPHCNRFLLAIISIKWSSFQIFGAYYIKQYCFNSVDNRFLHRWNRIAYRLNRLFIVSYWVIIRQYETNSSVLDEHSLYPQPETTFYENRKSLINKILKNFNLRKGHQVPYHKTMQCSLQVQDLLFHISTWPVAFMRKLFFIEGIILIN